MTSKITSKTTPFFLNSISFLFICLLCVQVGYSSNTPMQNTSKDTVNVGFAGSAPFIFHENDTWGGISAKIWQTVAKDSSKFYNKVGLSGVSEGIKALQTGKIDVLVGPISITAERAEHVQFSQPYFQSSLSILSRVDDPSFLERVSPFFSIRLLYGVLVFLFILACVGTLLWLAERKEQSDQFSEEPARGIGTGMWCAIVTMSTTGYGDIAPKTLMGRIVAGAWMVISIIFATTMVAGIASTLTITGMGSETISTAEQLQKKNIAVLQNSPATDFVEEHRGKVTSVVTLEEAYQLLKSKEVDAVVFDRPQLLYYLNENPDESLVVSIAQYQKQGYGFAYPLQTESLHDINVSLLRLKENGKVSAITKNWLGNKNE